MEITLPDQKLDEVEKIIVHVIALDEFEEKIEKIKNDEQAGMSGALAYFCSFKALFCALCKYKPEKSEKDKKIP